MLYSLANSKSVGGNFVSGTYVNLEAGSTDSDLAKEEKDRGSVCFSDFDFEDSGKEVEANKDKSGGKLKLNANDEVGVKTELDINVEGEVEAKLDKQDEGEIREKTADKKDKEEAELELDKQNEGEIEKFGPISAGKLSETETACPKSNCKFVQELLKSLNKFTLLSNNYTNSVSPF